MYLIQFTRTARVLEASKLADFRPRPEKTPRHKASFPTSVLGRLGGHPYVSLIPPHPFAGEPTRGEGCCAVFSAPRTHLDFDASAKIALPTHKGGFSQWLGRRSQRATLFFTADQLAELEQSAVIPPNTACPNR